LQKYLGILEYCDISKKSIFFRQYNTIQGGPKKRTCLSTDNSAMVIRRKVHDMSKVLECCRQKGPDLHSKSFKYSLPNLHKSPLPLKLGIYLHSHEPEFIELKNSPPKSPDFNSVNYSV